jgi:hypothetical protein
MGRLASIALMIPTLAGCRQLLGFEDVNNGETSDGPSPIDQSPAGDGAVDTPKIDGPPGGFACSTDPAQIACYTFDQDTLDHSTHAHHLTATGTSFGLGKDNTTGLSIIDGSSVTSADSTDFNVPTYTIRMFILPASLPPAAGRMGLFDSNLRYRMFLHPDGVIRCAFTNSANGSIELFSPSGAVAAGTYTRVACTYDGATLKVLINDVVVADKPEAQTLGSSNAGIVVGQNSPSGENFEGVIDNLEVWSGVH